MLTLRRRIDGVMVGVILSYLFWGSLLLRCGDVETNPGPPKPSPPTATSASTKDSMRQTRLSSAGAVRKPSAERSTDSVSPGSEPSLRDVISTLNDMKRDMDSGFRDVRQDVHDLREDFTTLHSELRELKEEVTELRRENEALKTTTNDLTAKLNEYEKRMDDLEGRSRRNNLLFYGLPRKDNETSADCEQLVQDLVKNKLNISDNVEFDRVHRLSYKADSLMIARCTLFKQKVQILKEKGKLRGSNVFIGEDFSKGVREIRRKLTPHLKSARQEGKRATMVFNHLLIDGKKFSLDASDRLVEIR